MGKIIDIKCNKCKEEFTTMPYFCKTDIHYKVDSFTGIGRYFASVVAKAVCPYCGELNEQICESEIHNEDVLDLAIRGYKRG